MHTSLPLNPSRIAQPKPSVYTPTFKRQTFSRLLHLITRVFGPFNDLAALHYLDNKYPGEID